MKHENCSDVGETVSVATRQVQTSLQVSHIRPPNAAKPPFSTHLHLPTRSRLTTDVISDVRLSYLWPTDHGPHRFWHWVIHEHWLIPVTNQLHPAHVVGTGCDWLTHFLHEHVTCHHPGPCFSSINYTWMKSFESRYRSLIITLIIQIWSEPNLTAANDHSMSV